jgi:16S rRNA (guanine527-N7)-methyltransferase
MSAAHAPPPDPEREALATLRELGMTPGAERDLETLRRLLEAWNGRMNLVGAATLASYWRRHVLDSAQLLALAPDARVWADLGSGAGFPGVVLAVLLKETPGAKVHLVESVAKRCRFLAEAVATLAIPAEVVNARAEDVKLKVDVAAARACAPLTRLLAFAQPFMTRGATGLFLKGRTAAEEIAEARRTWRFAARLIPSLSDPEGRVAEITELARG